LQHAKHGATLTLRVTFTDPSGNRYSATGPPIRLRR
jgi:hypothetical protein